MILVAGGTGRLGTVIVEGLTQRHLAVRVQTRNGERAKHLPGGVEIVVGDVRDRARVDAAVAGAKTVISAVQGLDDPKSSPDATDRAGNQNLIDAAKQAGVEHFIFVSGRPATPNHPMSMARAKYAAEQYLKQSGLSWTIIRPTAFMEFWATLVGKPIMETGQTRMLGPGNRPMNFVSVRDVAKAVEMAVGDPSLRGVEIEMGGPENLSLNEVVAIFERFSGRKAKVNRLPLPVMRIMSVALKPINPAMARIMETGVAMYSTDMTWDGAENRKTYPWLPQTSLIEIIEAGPHPVST
jgi:uncharacterized protein YbjT (DUF2867 family)